MLHGTTRPAVVGWDGHLLLTYREEDERVSALALWMQEGLDRGEKVLYAEGTPRPPRSVVLALQLAGIDLTAAQSQDRFEVLAPGALTSARAPESAIDVAVRSALSAGFPAVRVCAEATGALTPATAGRYARFEHRLDRLCAEAPVSALCQYRSDLGSDTDLDRVTGEHRQGLRESRVVTALEPDGSMLLAGEVDISNDELVASALRTATAPGSVAVGRGRLLVDLSGLDFLGVAGCRAVLRGTRRFRQAGGHVELVAAALVVRQVLELCGVGRGHDGISFGNDPG